MDYFPFSQSLMFTTMGAILCCTAGLILIRDWDNFSSNLIHAYLEAYSDQTVAAGSFAILAALVFAVDTYFTNKYDWSARKSRSSRISAGATRNINRPLRTSNCPSRQIRISIRQIYYIARVFLCWIAVLIKDSFSAFPFLLSPVIFVTRVIAEPASWNCTPREDHRRSPFL